MRLIRTIANDICSDWKKLPYNAKVYIEAMYSLNDINDSYGYDSARSIINYFLANAGTWKGEKAKAIKLELKQLLKG
jgi:hypothetical protein